MRKINKKGFTLVELMVVLAILGLLAGIGIPQYTKVMERARIGRDVAQIATVQTVVDAFMTETDWAKAGTELGMSGEKISDSVFGTSYLTGGKVKLAEFMDDNLPTLESADFNGATWYINAEGIVYVGTSSNKTLPDQGLDEDGTE